MKKLYYTATLCVAMVTGLTACTGEIFETPDGLNATRAAECHLIGPSDIIIGQFFEFTVDNTVFDLFKFEVEDVYFHDSTSYTLQPVDATRARIRFNEYGRFKVTATGVYDPTTKCAYEVGKYYDVSGGSVRYGRNGSEFFEYKNVNRTIWQWFDYYAQNFSGFEHRVVIKTKQKSFLNTFSMPARVDHRPGPVMGEITGTAKIGDRTIGLGDFERKLFPDSINNPQRYTVLEPVCDDTFTVPADHAGVVDAY